MQEFGPEGEFIRQFGALGAADGELSAPLGIAIAQGSGDVYVADAGNARIEEFGPSGEFVRKWGARGVEDGQFSNLRGLAIDPEGHVWTVEVGGTLGGKPRVQEFSAEGAYLGKFGGEEGAGDGQLQSPEGIAVSAAGNVYVADTGNDRIQEFRPSGEFVRAFGGAGGEEGQLSAPRGLAFDSEGDLWVTDTGNDRVEGFSGDGAYLTQLGVPGDNDGQFSAPEDVAVDGEGHIWVADTGDNRIEKWQRPSLEPSFLGAYGGEGSGPGHLSGPSDTATDAAGDVYVADTGHDRIQEFRPNGEFVRQFGGAGAADGELSAPRGIAIAQGSGDVYVADTGNDRIEEFEGNGKFVGKWGTVGTEDGQFRSPQGVAVDGEGHVWTIEAGNAGSSIGARVQEFSAAGAFIASFGEAGTGNGQFKQPGGIAIGPAGNVYVADTGNDRIQEFKPSGEFVRAFGGAGGEEGQVSAPRGLAFDSEGDLWVADTGNDRVEGFNPEGVYLRQLGAAGDGEGQLSAPGGLATDKEGDLWIADTGGNRIEKWQIWSGPDTTIISGPSGLINSLSASFVLSANEPGSSFECSLDYVEFTSCPSPELYEGLSEGAHVFRTRATNAAGSQDPTAARREFSVDATPPETTITSGPSALVNTSSASFSFAASEESTFECKLDSGAWQSCASPTSYKSLADGPHTFEVRAADIAGNLDQTPASLTWTIDTTPPQTTIESPQPTYTEHEQSKIEFSSNEAESSFKCSLDDAKEEATTPCTSPYELPAHLAAGWHTFVVAATDKAGNTDPTAAKWVFNTGPYPTVAEPTSNKLSSPEEGRKTASYYTLRSAWGNAPEGGGVTSIAYQLKLPAWNAFRYIPTRYLVDPEDKQPGWALPVGEGPGTSEPLYFDVKAFAEAEGWAPIVEGLQLRAVFNGGKSAAGATTPITTTYTRFAGGPDDATETVGPATVDLLTGAFTISRTDVSIPVPGSEATLEFSRTYNSAYGANERTNSKTLGQMWQPSAPVESEYQGEAWQKLLVRHEDAVPAKYNAECQREVGEIEKEEKEFGEWSGPIDPETCLEEYAIPEQNWVEVLNNGGAAIPFDNRGGSYIPPEEAREYQLTKPGATFVLTESNGTRTEFSENGTTNEYVPSAIAFAGTSKTAQLVYNNSEGKMRLTTEIGPAPAGVVCNPLESESNYAPITPGCRSLKFTYINFAIEGGPTEQRLDHITYYDSSGSGVGQVVARYGYYTSTGNLAEEWDPRVTPEVLKERYAYESTEDARLTQITPAGEEPWKLAYYPAGSGGAYEARLRSVSRASLVEGGPANATTTIAYDVPVKGEGAPYGLGLSTISQWGQSDYPVEATAVFPPTEVPGEKPSDYSQAVVHYMDPAGFQVNTASPAPPGVEGSSITTSEFDSHGDVVRELGAQARLEALGASHPAARSHELDSHSTYAYAEEGARLLESESWGPLHKVRLESGETVEARRHTKVVNDQGFEHKAGETWPDLPTTETTGAVVPGREGELETAVTETRYNWSLRRPTEAITDPKGLDLVTTTAYNSAGQVTEERQPSNPEGGGAGTTKTVYWTAGANPEIASCGGKSAWAGLPCVAGPAAQASPAEANPKVLVKRIAKYSTLGEPEETIESPGGSEEPGKTRTTTVKYDAAGRQYWVKTVGGGTSVPAVETLYNSSNGIPEAQKFVCEAPESCSGFDDEEVKATFDALGRPVAYEDADGNRTTTTYDLDGRPATTSDAKGTRTFHYDELSGVLTRLEDSGAGTFTAAYDANGSLVERGLPDGLTAKTTYNAAGESTGLAYTKTSSCGESCTWYEETLARSIYGQILTDDGTLVSDHYSYDKDGRLVEARETPGGSGCTSRSYTYDADSNRLTRTVREPGAGGACATTGGSTQEYHYDTADRLLGAGLTYDAWGRITDLPAADAGGHALVTGYYSTNMVARQEQAGITNSYELDASGRQRARLQGGGGLEGTEVFHYDGPGDSLSWTSLGPTWTRDVTGIGGELAAIQESSGTTTFKLTDLHGDVVASASSSPTATSLLATYRFDEFGEPEGSGGAARFGWLGGKSRRTELSSGVIQMGARSYIPQLGRFLTPDPVRGGSANPYDYVNQDPVNGFDLGGECTYGKKHPHCIGTQSPKQLRQETRTANRERAISVHFRSQHGAEHFYHALTSGSHWVERIIKKAGEWNERDIREVEARAAKIAHEEAIFGPRPEPSSPDSCKYIAEGAGVAALVPTPATVVLGAAGAITGAGSLLGLC